MPNASLSAAAFPPQRRSLCSATAASAQQPGQRSGRSASTQRSRSSAGRWPQPSCSQGAVLELPVPPVVAYGSERRLWFLLPM